METDDKGLSVFTAANLKNFLRGMETYPGKDSAGPVHVPQKLP